MKLYLQGCLFILLQHILPYSGNALVIQKKQATGRHHDRNIKGNAPEEEADDDGPDDDNDSTQAATQFVAKVEQGSDNAKSPEQADAENATQAAEDAKQAAVVANNVAEHSIKVHHHAQSALNNALGALHDARTESTQLDENQKDSLKKAEAKLHKATQKANYGDLKKVESAEDVEKANMKKDLAKDSSSKSELEQIRADIRDIRQTLQAKGRDDDEAEKQLSNLERDVDTREQEHKTNGNDDMKAEVERLRNLAKVDRLRNSADDEKGRYNPLAQEEKSGEDDGEYMTDVKMKPLEGRRHRGTVASAAGPDATPLESIDIDTELPYGDLEPFGREDTAQELTENSVKESDEMVDQLERAEVAEEKRAVFRALTRLRGAAITSFDGVARSQTGNIDEYNKVHKWRKVHPMRHLADEESDVTKWAFPDNADLLQENYTAHVPK